jgi:hypothetical protein
MGDGSGDGRRVVNLRVGPCHLRGADGLGLVMAHLNASI